MVIEVNKDIDRYQESVAMGLTARQLIFSIASVVVGGGIVLLLYKYIGLTGSAYVAIPCVAPIADHLLQLGRTLGEADNFTEYYRAANVTVSARFCLDDIQLGHFLQGFYNDSKKFRFDKEASSSECVAKLNRTVKVANSHEDVHEESNEAYVSAYGMTPQETADEDRMITQAEYGAEIEAETTEKDPSELQYITPIDYAKRQYRKWKSCKRIS